MRTIQKFLPNPRHIEIKRIFVKATPEEAWEVVRHFDASAIKWVGLLFNIRTLPERLTGKEHPQKDHRIGIDQIADNGTGFMILHEAPCREVVIGSVGQFWHLNIRFANVRPEDFKEYNQPGWGKLAWALVVEPYLEGSTISFELRTTATDKQSWKKFKNYYKVIGIGSKAIRRSLMQHYETLLGKMEIADLNEAALPGDDIIPGATYTYTHAKTVEAPSDLIWRYLMQLGCDRAGWYSIDLLDHGGKPSTDHLVDGWENRNIGDKLAATPKGDDFFEVYAVGHDEYFVIGGQGKRFGKDFKMSWSFILEKIGDDAVKLITRVRFNIEPGWNAWLQGNLLAPAMHGIMQQVQLKTLKRYAERDALLR